MKVRHLARTLHSNHETRSELSESTESGSGHWFFILLALSLPFAFLCHTFLNYVSAGRFDPLQIEMWLLFGYVLLLCVGLFSWLSRK